jgi:hypothetical protein
MRRAFWRELSTTPADFRARFRTTGAARNGHTVLVGDA